MTAADTFNPVAGSRSARFSTEPRGRRLLQTLPRPPIARRPSLGAAGLPETRLRTRLGLATNNSVCYLTPCLAAAGDHEPFRLHRLPHCGGRGRDARQISVGLG